MELPTEQFENGDVVKLKYDSLQTKSITTDEFVVVSSDVDRGAVVEMRVERNGKEYLIATGHGPLKANIRGRDRSGSLHDLGTPINIKKLESEQ